MCLQGPSRESWPGSWPWLGEHGEPPSAHWPHGDLPAHVTVVTMLEVCCVSGVAGSPRRRQTLCNGLKAPRLGQAGRESYVLWVLVADAGGGSVEQHVARGHTLPAASGRHLLSTCAALGTQRGLSKPLASQGACEPATTRSGGDHDRRGGRGWGAHCLTQGGQGRPTK